ncbi:MAG: bifunctional hydroxymethylpyrimidine kinase/phosphomethylpyrimidine kinase [Bacillota bacterium]
MKNVLTIAGSDSGGGAGIQADLKTFSALQVYGMSVITSVTAQNTTGVYGIEDLSPQIVGQQLEAVFSDIPVEVVKIGMVSQKEIIAEIAAGLQKFNPQKVILDPVMVSGSGDRLLCQEAENYLVEKLFPLAFLVTPNIPEAEVLLGSEINSLHAREQAVREIARLGPSCVLLKGGHSAEDRSTDVFYDGQEVRWYQEKVIATENTHGTGCTLSSAIAAYLARGLEIEDAIEKAKHYLTGALAESFCPGQGQGPVHHFHEYYRIKQPDREVSK